MLPDVQSRVGANALLFFYYGDENGPKKLGGAAISMVIHFFSDIWRGYTPPAQNTQIHAVTYAPTLLCHLGHQHRLAGAEPLYQGCRAHQHIPRLPCCPVVGWLWVVSTAPSPAVTTARACPVYPSTTWSCAWKTPSRWERRSTSCTKLISCPGKAELI